MLRERWSTYTFAILAMRLSQLDAPDTNIPATFFTNY